MYQQLATLHPAGQLFSLWGREAAGQHVLYSCTDCGDLHMELVSFGMQPKSDDCSEFGVQHKSDDCGYPVSFGVQHQKLPNPHNPVHQISSSPPFCTPNL